MSAAAAASIASTLPPDTPSTMPGRFASAVPCLVAGPRLLGPW